MFNGHDCMTAGVWTGAQLHWHINCLELLAVHLALNRLRDAYEASMYWSVWTARRLLCTSTDKVVYAPVAYHNSPVTSSSGSRKHLRFASRHSYPGLAQPDSRRAVTSCAPRRVETPSPDGPATADRGAFASMHFPQ